MPRYEQGNRHYWHEFMAIGLSCLWHDLKESIVETWREAGEATYGDNCTHPESGLSEDCMRQIVTCNRCGKKRGSDPNLPWWSAEDFLKPKHWEHVPRPDGGYDVIVTVARKESPCPKPM